MSRSEPTGVSSRSMASHHAPPAAVGKRGDPNWGRSGPMPLGPALATEFEIQVKQLRLTPETYVHSAELRTWCGQNRNRIYIPEWLLQAWDILVEPNLSDDA